MKVSSVISAAALALLLSGQAFAQLDPPHPNPAQPRGALTGANIFINPGHGWLFNANNGRWGTQRTLSFGVIEDHDNTEAVIQHFLPFLWHAGANVYMARERDINHHEVIVDNGGPGVVLDGRWSIRWHDRGAYKRDFLTAPTTTNPDEAARAWFVPNIPEAGNYAVYAWYSPENRDNAAPDARYEIHHAGGVTTWVQDQSRDYRTWKYIGTYWFEPGENQHSGSVSVSSLSNNEGRVVTADAIRFGGGMSDFIESGTTTGRPRFEDSGMYYSQYIGYDSTVETRSFNSVRAMPMWAEWECEPWQIGTSVYLSWHSNASGAAGNARGFSTFVYSTLAWDTNAGTFTGFPLGVELGRTVHNGVMKGVRAQYDPEWRDIGIVGRWLGETNPESNNKMPAIVLEYGFFDNPEDAAYIIDPIFRDHASFGTYRGTLEFFTQNIEGFNNTTVIPGRPEAPRAVRATDGSVALAWKEAPFYDSNGPDAVANYHLGDRARSYRVASSTHGRAFDRGIVVEYRNDYTPAAIPGEARYFRIQGINEGGESLPAETVGIRIPAPGESDARILIVNGFHRLDRGMSLVEEPRAPYVLQQDRARTRESYNAPMILPREMRTSLGNERPFLHKMNTRDYVVEHGNALAAAGYGFESASSHAVADGSVSLSDYDAVVWIMGKERNGRTFDSTTRPIVDQYLASGGRLFVSGADLAQDLFAEEAGNQFLEAKLGTRFIRDLAPAESVSGLPDTPFAGLEGIVFGETRSVYPVDTADIIMAVGQGRAALRYHGPSGQLDHAAAVTIDTGDYRAVMMGFPFESITSPVHRAAVMERAMQFLLAAPSGAVGQ